MFRTTEHKPHKTFAHWFRALSHHTSWASQRDRRQAFLDMRWQSWNDAQRVGAAETSDEKHVSGVVWVYYKETHSAAARHFLKEDHSICRIKRSVLCRLPQMWRQLWRMARGRRISGSKPRRMYNCASCLRWRWKTRRFSPTFRGSFAHHHFQFAAGNTSAVWTSRTCKRASNFWKSGAVWNLYYRLAYGKDVHLAVFSLLHLRGRRWGLKSGYWKAVAAVRICAAFFVFFVANNVLHAQPGTFSYVETERQGRALYRLIFGNTMIIEWRRHGGRSQEVSMSSKHNSIGSVELFDTTVPTKRWTLLFCSPN